MKIGIITTPNQKGQIVIPKEVRDKLDINENTPLNILVRDHGFWVYPIESIKSKIEKESSYLAILEKTRGSWGASTKQELKRQKQKRKLELRASKKITQPW